jgi:6-phosphogluconolactonase
MKLGMFHRRQMDAAVGLALSIAIVLGLTLLSSPAAFAESFRDGAVYAMTNDAVRNEVVVFGRSEDGILTKAGSAATGGSGFGSILDPLGSQGSLVLSQNTRWLLAVNAGSNDISVFRVQPHGLVLTDRVASGGVLPVSIATFGKLVYVLNAGGSPNIAGFELGRSGELTPLADSTRLLGAGAFAQIGFDPQGENLVVTDKASNSILVYPMGADGLPAVTPVTSPSNGVTPFGLTFDQRGHLLVVEAGPNAVSSYDISDDGALQVISLSVPNGQVAACWIAGTPRGFVFTANPGTHSISSYKLKAGSGKLVLFQGVAGIGTSPIDISPVDTRFLYALDPGNGGVDMFRVEQDGSLTSLGTAAGGFSISAQGIAAR